MKCDLLLVFAVFQLVSYQRPNLSRMWSELMSVVCVSLSLLLSPAGAVLVFQKHVGVEQRLLQPGRAHEPAGLLLLPPGGGAWRSVTR